MVRKDVKEEKHEERDAESSFILLSNPVAFLMTIYYLMPCDHHQDFPSERENGRQNEVVSVSYSVCQGLTHCR